MKIRLLLYRDSNQIPFLQFNMVTAGQVNLDPPFAWFETAKQLLGTAAEHHTLGNAVKVSMPVIAIIPQSLILLFFR